MALRDAFLSRLGDRLYSYLSDGPLKDWDVSDVIGFADGIIVKNEGKIDNYLKEKKVTLENINESIEDILKNLLIPSVVIE